MNEEEHFAYLTELNEVQQQAVKATDGAVMIVAGAGSGKTRVLTYRIAHLLNVGIDSFNILALTFTNKAAREMKERINKIVGDKESRNLWMGTFHSVFARILRYEAEKIGYPTNFTIYDTDDAKSLIKSILKEQGLDEKVYKPNLVYSRISAAKNNLIAPAAYFQNAQIMDDDRMSGKPKLADVYRIYQNRLFKSGAMDFDDLLFNTNVLLRDHTDVLYKYQNKFRYILVDEYQDTNFSQYVIVKQLAARFQNICVVGDDAQSIYAFRGANIQNILNFEKDYPDLKTFKLEQNYRSTQTIVEAANAVIANNREQIKKQVWTDNALGDKIKLLQTLSDNEEGMQVAHSIFETSMQHQAKHEQFAILYRTNAQSRSMEEALRKLNIPYRIYGGVSFYQRKEIKDVLAYFRLAINNHDEESLKRVINYPARGIGDTSISKILLAANDNDTSTWNVLDNMHLFNIGINSGTAQKIYDFVTLIKSFSAMLGSTNAFDLAEHITQHSGVLKDLYNDKTPEGVSRYENIQELLNGIREFSEKGNEAIDLPEEENENLGEQQSITTLDAFMKDVALLTDADGKTDNQNRNVVSLMTVHAAKGLEFPYVYIVGMEENLFPSQLSLTSRTDLEEERRLFYVALTRAEKRIHISYAATRYRWGNLIHCEPSRFIEEINSNYIETTAKPEQKRQINISGTKNIFEKRVSKPAEQAKPLVKKNLVHVRNAVTTVNPADNAHLKDLQKGMQVEHERFGSGRVVAVEGEYPNSKATVEFDGHGQKQLLLKFAKLKITG
jgi:DNA helicase-2/ATP-dependent DNA helicase PcrA